MSEELNAADERLIATLKTYKVPQGQIGELVGVAGGVDRPVNNTPQKGRQMTRRNLFTAVVAAGVLAAVGCGPNKLNVAKTFDLSTEKPAVTFDAPGQGAAQTVKVEVTSDNTVDVYVLLNAPADAVNMEEKELKAKAVASKTGTKGETLTVQVPAGQAVTVWVGRSGVTQKASGSVKMTN